MDILADASRIVLAVIALLFSLMMAIHDRPRILAIFGLCIALPAIQFALYSNGAAPFPAIVINAGTAGVLGWFCFAHPHIGLVPSWRADPWVQKWQGRRR